MTTDLFITFDVENRADQAIAPDDMVLGQAADGRFGPIEIAAALRARDLCATFFVDILDDQVSGEAAWAKVDEAVVHGGSSVALHTHGEWIRPGWRGLTGGSLEDTRAVIREAVERFEQTFGRKPLVHRAGWLKMDPAAYTDLHREGIVVDSTPTQLMSCPLREHFVPNVPQTREGVVVLPVTNYDTMPIAPLSHLRTLDLVLATPREFASAIQAVVRDRAAVVVTLTHSFSFLSPGPNGECWLAQRAIERFTRNLDFLAEAGYLRARVMDEAAELTGDSLRAAPAVHIPRVGWGAFMGAVRHRIGV